jgi:hypothetical protein
VIAAFGELSIGQRDADHDPHTVSVWLTVQGSRSITEAHHRARRSTAC